MVTQVLAYDVPRICDVAPAVAAHEVAPLLAQRLDTTPGALQDEALIVGEVV